MTPLFADPWRRTMPDLPCDAYLPGRYYWTVRWVRGADGIDRPTQDKSGCFTCFHPEGSHRASVVETYSSSGPFMTAPPRVVDRGATDYQLAV